MSNESIPIDKARVYWNDETGEVVVGTVKHPATSDSRKYPSWICVGGADKPFTQVEAIADLFGEVLWLWERDRINLKAALIEVRKIEGVTEWLDRGRIWI